MNYIEAARVAYDALDHKTRNDGTEFYSFGDSAPEWCEEMTFAAHGSGEIFPDDWRYEFIRDALAALSDLPTDSDEDAAREHLDQSTEPDVYNGRLCAWLASNLQRIGYVDEAREEYGPASGIMEDIQRGQFTEAREIADSVLSFLLDKFGEADCDD